MDNFFCIAKPTVNNQVKGNITYYLDFAEEGQVEVFGLTAASNVRHFNASLDEAEGKFVINGGYSVGDADIDFIFEFELSSASFPVGSGEWVETLSSSEQVRQKYQVEIWPAALGHLDATFLGQLFSKIGDVESRLKVVSGEVSKAHSDIADLAPSIDNANSAATVFSEHTQKLNTLIAKADQEVDRSTNLFDAFSTLMDRVSDQEGKVTSIRDRNTVLLKNLEATGESALDTTNKALEAMASTTTKNLAEAFKKRKDEAGKSEYNYNKVFYASVIGALALALVMWFAFPIGQADSAADYLQYILVRAPFFAFPVWLAIFASKKSSHSARLEEFYAQKQALAESYQGYKDQIYGLYPDDTSPEELVALMGMNLASIGKDSADVIDKLRDEKHSPWESIVEILLSRVRTKATSDVSE